MPSKPENQQPQQGAGANQQNRGNKPENTQQGQNLGNSDAQTTEDVLYGQGNNKNAQRNNNKK
ncbi:hypothetical protein GQ53DRAFT_825861 [Thozetella sp. PMI_491]|nr:hypothetical protein GQ53DRAFT_825861 [Thozetella sp. PMI_491]